MGPIILQLKFLINNSEDNKCPENDAFDTLPLSALVASSHQWQNLHRWKQFPQPPILHLVSDNSLKQERCYLF